MKAIMPICQIFIGAMKILSPIVRTLCAGLVVLYLASQMSGCGRTPPPAFNAEVWKASGKLSDKDHPRLGMADDLIRTKTLEKLRKEQVLEMLGDPGDHGYFKEYDLVYWLGPERSFFSIDSEWLAIKLDKKSGTVESYRIVRD